MRAQKIGILFRLNHRERDPAYVVQDTRRISRVFVECPL